MSRLYIASILGAFALLTACGSPEIDPINERIERIENGIMPAFQIAGQPAATFNVNDRLDELGIPGLSVAFVSDGKIEWARAYGMADVTDNTEMTPDTLLLAGSISKPVAAVRALQMVESGAFALDENVNDYLVSWKVPDNEFTATEKVTLRRILNHTAGLTVWGFPGYDKGDDIPSVVNVLDGKGNTDAVRVYKQPGEGWQYSGGGYTIMQLMIADQEAPSTFPESLQSNVLNPLGMSASTFENPLPATSWESAATGYRASGNEVEGKWPIYPEMAAAGLWTTPSQLIQYAIEIQEILQEEKDGLLEYDTVVEMLDAEPGAHGLGPSIAEHTFGHGGADEGFRARLIAWKDHPHALVIMVNSDNGSIIQEVALSVATEYDLPGVNPTIRTPIELSSATMQQFAGSYNIGELGTLNLAVDGQTLRATGQILPEPAVLSPESERTFFNVADGSRVTFEFDDGEVTGFRIPGLAAEKID